MSETRIVRRNTPAFTVSSADGCRIPGAVKPGTARPRTQQFNVQQAGVQMGRAAVAIDMKKAGPASNGKNAQVITPAALKASGVAISTKTPGVSDGPTIGLVIPAPGADVSTTTADRRTAQGFGGGSVAVRPVGSLSPLAQAQKARDEEIAKLEAERADLAAERADLLARKALLEKERAAIAALEAEIAKGLEASAPAPVAPAAPAAPAAAAPTTRPE